MIRVNIKKLKDSVKTPAYATEGSAAVDLRAANDSPIVIEAGEIAKIPTGIAIALPDNNAVAVVCARSGLATKFGISLANGIGVIDSDYRGELIVALINNGKSAFTVEPGERIAQLMFMPVLPAIFTECEELDKTERGEGGFGSTGTK
ncbi:MAG: dUTP diphosphatase [Ruminococcaceae bacterium]|nr:dUTP diphosphatase [Oscillospiraceae bacterium]